VAVQAAAVEPGLGKVLALAAAVLPAMEIMEERAAATAAVVAVALLQQVLLVLLMLVAAAARE
jgi:hypothetical protein